MSAAAWLRPWSRRGGAVYEVIVSKNYGGGLVARHLDESVLRNHDAFKAQ